MQLHVQYLTDNTGAKTAVQIPFSEWMSFMSEHQHLREYSCLKKQLTTAMEEVRKMEKSNVKPVTLDEFLNDL
jgi:hypothetical protein